MKDGRADDERGRVLAATELARRFHETYAGLAPAFGEDAHTERAVPWAAVQEQQKRLMIAVCYEVLQGDAAGFAPLQSVVIGIKQAWDGVCACHDALEDNADADACGEDEDRFDAAIAHLVAVLDSNPPDASKNATWGTDGHR